jgi:hypothetical protein
VTFAEWADQNSQLWVNDAEKELLRIGWNAGSACERDACSKVAEEVDGRPVPGGRRMTYDPFTAKHIAASAIRARGLE